MNDIKLKLLNRLLTDEGQYSNHQSDPGGATKYGVTQAVARARLDRDARDVTWEDALFVAEADYWKPLLLDSILDITGSEELTFKLLTIGYNMGVSRAARFLQRVLVANSMPISVDGQVGQNTLDATYTLINKRGQEFGTSILLKYVTGLQAAHYIGLTEKDDKFKDFTAGWSKRL